MVWRLLAAIAGILFICGGGFARELLDLFPARPGTLICWTEIRSDPRPVRIHYLKVALDSKDLEVLALPGEDPDGAGPAESRLTPPVELFEKYRALAAVNANAFAAVSPPKQGDVYWYEGQPVDIHGLVVSRGKKVSPVETGRVPFWLDQLQKPHMGDPAAGKPVKEAVSDWFSPLLESARIVADVSSQALHPRTALGFDYSGEWLLMVVVDGRQPGYSEGVTLYELADILKSAGCSQSINLDGGGSSIMLIRQPGRTVQTFNSPSGKNHRPVPVMLGVREAVR